MSEIDLYVTRLESGMDWDTNTPLLHAFGRTEGGYADEVVIRGFFPYFYVDPGHGVTVGDHDELVSIEPAAVDSVFGTPVEKVTFTTPWTSVYYELKDLFPTGTTHEADVSYENRFRIDHDVYTGIRVPQRDCSPDDVEPIDFVEDLRKVTFDIETDDRGDGFPDPGEARITGIVAHDSFSDETVAFYDLHGDSFEDRFGTDVPESLAESGLDFGEIDGFVFEDSEKSMLRRFADYVGEIDPDVLVAWNINFDAPHVVARMDEIGADSGRLSRMGKSFVTNRGEAVVKGRTCYDLLYAYKKSQLKELSSYKLNAVAAEELGHEKVDHEGIGYYEMYYEHPELFVKYNVADVNLTVGIDLAAGVFDFKLALRHEVGLSLDDTVDNHSMIEMFARRELYSQGVVGPTAAHPDVDEYDGGHVFPAFTGLTTNVTGVDLASLYPNTMAMFNMSPETTVDLPADADPVAMNQLPGMNVAKAPNGTWFDQSEPGIFAALVDKAIGLKEGYGKAKDAAEGAERAALQIKYDAAKSVTNSLYGVLGWKHFFLYDRDVALAITSAGVECIKTTERYFSEDTEGEVIYGDTDSNYVEWPAEWTRDLVISTAQGACAELNTEVYPTFAATFGISPEDNRWEIETESYAVTFFQHGKKKRYAMHITWDEGTEVDKKKVIGYKRSDVSAVTSELIDGILDSIVRGLDTDEVSRMMMDASDEIQPEGADIGRLAIPGGLGKHLDDYDWTNGTPKSAQPRGAYFSNHLLGTEFKKDDKPKRVYVKPFPTEIDGEVKEVDVLCVDDSTELPEDVQLDVQRMENTLIVNPLNRILTAAGVDIKASMKGQTQSGLGQFTGAGA